MHRAGLGALHYLHCMHTYIAGTTITMPALLMHLAGHASGMTKSKQRRSNTNREPAVKVH